MAFESTIEVPVISVAFVLAIVTRSVRKDVLFRIFSGLSDATLAPFVPDMHVVLWVLAATSVVGTPVSLMRPRHTA